MMTPPRPGYEVVMATRNRAGILGLSLPLLLGQSRPPEAVIVVDSSDDPAPVAAAVAAAAAASPVPVRLLRSEAGLPRQRNAGLAACRAEVVMFPDDDSLYFPDAAAEIMAIYEADTAGAVAAVAGREAAQPPLPLPGRGTVATEAPGAALARTARLRRRRALVPAAADPLERIGSLLNGRHPVPAWLAGFEAVPVAYMTGFRMTFRRSAIAGPGFDARLPLYAVGEDRDASFSAMRAGLVVAAPRARIFHHRVAGARAGGYRLGYWSILNRAYVLLKHVDADPDLFPDREAELRRLRRHARLRLCAWLAGIGNGFGRDRLRGGWAGLGAIGRLAAARGPALGECYEELVRAHAGHT